MFYQIDENLREARDEQSAYDSGYDAGLNGPNTTNCSFRLFSTPKKTRSWERGKAAGDLVKSVQLMEKESRGQG